MLQLITLLEVQISHYCTLVTFCLNRVFTDIKNSHKACTEAEKKLLI